MQLPSSEKNIMPTLVNVVMNGSDAKMMDAKMVDKVGIATIVANKATWHATVQSIDRHPEDESVGNQCPTRREDIRAETVRDGFDPAPKAEKGPRRPRRHLRRPSAGRPGEELNTTISTNKPEGIRHFGVSTSKEANLSMRLCSWFEGAFAHVLMTPLTPA